MNEARPYASLSSGLLARKGTAKPAMRPQGYNGFEDLGWNDMGHGPAAEPCEDDDLPQHVPSSIAALTPAPKPARSVSSSSEDRGAEAAESHPDPDETPSVVAQQRAIADSFDGHEELEPIPAAPRAVQAQVVALPKRGKPLAAGKKAAFTLRLDAERHLRLRLACALTSRSAQQIVTDALDELLASHPEVETLASRVPAKAGANGTKRS